MGVGLSSTNRVSLKGEPESVERWINSFLVVVFSWDLLTL